MSSLSRYALRLLAPFQGVLQIIDSGGARALSPDGLEWQIQVRVDTRNSIWGEIEGEDDATRLMVYGIWTTETGLVRLPFDPMADLDEARRQAEDMVALLPQASTELPFPLADQIELWLFDTESRPLALLASRRPEDPLPRQLRHQWQGSPSLHNARHIYSLAEDDLVALHESGDAMAQLVARSAGSSPEIRWVDRREPQASADFPPLGVRHHWSEGEQDAIAMEWLRWQAPLLLMLPDLDVTLRERLEAMAMRQASNMARYWRTWPTVLDHERLQAALVAARLQAGVLQD